MKELEIFEAVHGRPLMVGMMVTIDPRNRYVSDWPGKFVVTGINWDLHHRCMNVTISESFDDGQTDGWKPDDLRPVL